MEIIKTVKDEGTELALAGRLDTTTAPELHETLTALFAEGVNHLILDLKELEYISSAGLRELLFAQKNIDDEGSFVIINANEVIMEIFGITGFTDILTIE